jgi:hypothetical protein
MDWALLPNLQSEIRFGTSQLFYLTEPRLTVLVAVAGILFCHKIRVCIIALLSLLPRSLRAAAPCPSKHPCRSHLLVLAMFGHARKKGFSRKILEASLVMG